MNKHHTPTIERRLQKRYAKLVKAHMHTGTRTAAGLTLPQGVRKAFTATQGAWRFFNNERIKLSDLIVPLRESGKEAAQTGQSFFTLLVHDWSKLDYGTHVSKKDVAQLTHKLDRGYELTTALLVSADTGLPLAPMELHLKAKHRFYSTRQDTKEDNHLNQVLPTMEASKQWQLPTTLVHVIDREADSIRHMRAWHEAGHLLLVRIDDRKVRWSDKEQWLAEVLPRLTFQPTEAVRYRKKKARLYVAETDVTLDRPAASSKHVIVPGKPLTARLVVSRIVGKNNEILAQWFLLTNVPAEANTSTVAQWYYWRWQIESFFKLLKSSGLEMEYWQQETALAITRRLLVAAMACVTVWQLQRDKTATAEKMKLLLMRLSGRATKRSRPITTPGLLHGLFVLLPMLELIEEYHGDLSSIRSLAFEAIPFLAL